MRLHPLYPCLQLRTGLWFSTATPRTLPFLPLLSGFRVSPRRRESFCGLGRSFGRGGNKKQSSQRGVDRRWHHHHHHHHPRTDGSFVAWLAGNRLDPRERGQARVQSGTLLRFLLEKCEGRERTNLLFCVRNGKGGYLLLCSREMIFILFQSLLIVRCLYRGDSENL